MSITTGDFAKAIAPFYACDSDTVADWCEEGLLKARRNPYARLTRPKWQIVPSGISEFLKTKLFFDENEVQASLKALPDFSFQLNILVA